MRPYAWSDTYIDGIPDLDPAAHFSVEIRGGTMTIRPRRSRTVVAQFDGVTAVDRTARSSTTVRFDAPEGAGTVVLTRPKNCGCHGAR